MIKSSVQKSRQEAGSQEQQLTVSAQPGRPGCFHAGVCPDLWPPIPKRISQHSVRPQSVCTCPDLFLSHESQGWRTHMKADTGRVGGSTGYDTGHVVMASCTGQNGHGCVPEQRASDRGGRTRQEEEGGGEPRGVWAFTEITTHGGWQNSAHTGSTGPGRPGISSSRSWRCLNREQGNENCVLSDGSLRSGWAWAGALLVLMVDGSARGGVC